MRRTSGAENFQSTAKKDFFNTIGAKLPFTGPVHVAFTGASGLQLKGDLFGVLGPIVSYEF